MDPSGDAVIQLLILFILLALSAFFSSSETALVTVNKIRMRNMAEGWKQTGRNGNRLPKMNFVPLLK